MKQNFKNQLSKYWKNKSATPSPLPETETGVRVGDHVFHEVYKEYGEVWEIVDNEYCRVDFGKGRFTNGKTKISNLTVVGGKNPTPPTPGNERGQIWPEKITAAEVEAGVKWSFAVCFEIARRYNEYKETPKPGNERRDSGEGFDWTTHGDFKKYYDTSQKRNYWVLGYFGGKSVNICDAMKLAKQYAKSNFVPLESVVIDEILHSRRFKGFKFIYSQTIQEPENDASQSANVWNWLTN